MNRITIFFSLLFISLIGLSWPAHLQSGDNRLSIATAKAIYHDGTMLIDESYQILGKLRPETDTEGKSYSHFGIGLPLLYLPAVALTDFLATLIDPELSEHLVFSALPAVFGILLHFAFYETMRRLGIPSRQALVLTFTSSVFTLIFRYMVHDHSEIIQASLLVCALFLILDKRHWFELLAFSLLSFLIMIKTYNIVIYGLFGLYAVYRACHLGRPIRRTFINAGAPLILTLLIIGYLNHLRYGSALESGYGREVSSFGFGFTYFWRDFLDLLFSLEMGFFAFSPLLILGVYGFVTKFSKHWAIASLAFGTAGFLWLLSSFFYEPKGAWSLGPRYMVPAIPLLCLGLGFINYQSRVIRIIFVLLLTPAAFLTPLYVLQKTQEYDVIRFNLSEDHTVLPAQIPGLAKVLLLKARGHMDQRYPVAEFTKQETSGEYNLKDYQTYRAVNTWYSHLSYQFDLPLRRPLLALHLLLFLVAYLSLVGLLLPDRTWQQERLAARDI